MVLSSVCVMAQHEQGSLTLQPKVGLNLANLTNDTDAKMRVGLAAGLEAEYYASDIVSISFGALYSMQGAKYDTTVNELKATAKLKLDYLNIPILANVYVVPGLAVKLGVQPGFCISKKYTGEAGYYKEIGNIKDQVKGFDLSIPVGLSYEYANFQLDARYNFGVTKVFKDEGEKSKNSVIQITLGYKFEI